MGIYDREYYRGETGDQAGLPVWRRSARRLSSSTPPFFSSSSSPTSTSSLLTTIYGDARIHRSATIDSGNY